MALFPPRRYKLLRAFFRRVLRTPYFLTRTRHGLLLLIDEGSALDRSIVRRATFDAEQTARLFGLARRAAERLAKPFDVIDAGSRKGLYAMLAAREERAGEILALEPDVRRRNQLGAQLFLNTQSERIEILPTAIGGTATPPRSRLAGDRDAPTPLLPLERRRVRSGVPKTQPLDAVIDWKNRLIVGSVDAREDGTAFLDGARRVVGENLCLWQIECNAGGEENLDAVAETLNLRLLDVIGRDRYFTNIPPEALKT